MKRLGDVANLNVWHVMSMKTWSIHVKSRGVRAIRRDRTAAVAAAWEDGLISSATADGYLSCGSEVFQAKAEVIKTCIR